jgi:aspartyl/asparaginyl beta-hydroxylase (cupin superfamily)
LQEGEVVEIDNNDKYHSVENNSDIDRVHLLIDWLDKDNDLQHKT